MSIGPRTCWYLDNMLTCDQPMICMVIRGLTPAASRDSSRRLQGRLRKLLGERPAPELLTLATEWAKMDAGGLDQLEAWLNEHPSARLVIVDTLARVRPRPTRSGDPYAEDYAVGESLKAIADKHGVAVLVYPPPAQDGC